MLSECYTAVSGNRFVAFVARFAELLHVVRLAVGMALVLIKYVRSKRLLAGETNEMLGMPDLPETSDRPTDHWFLAVVADAFEELEVACVAV